ncbi:hypothetical protein AXE65_08855 [Ventosimonas gracilis]|uniref:Uncharacterized protein n=1 Tax=Ventosimonas gracilis TaxID=1680762 RepID=A0A139SYB0_9GAMM|nr:hypothetical protein [Ventosimonas gracilis]KXU39382.1 hypothetical protein AXE65_08855 [Ventosimonas gracilis]
MPRFVGARDLAITRTLDYEDGGLALQNPAGGLNNQIWRAQLLNAGERYSAVQMQAETVEPFILWQQPYIEEISFSFDQNMQPVLAYVQAGQAKLRFFDSTVQAFAIIELEPGAITPRVALDDKRDFLGYAQSDVILAYVLNGHLIKRLGSERYLNTHLVQANVGHAGLIKIGINQGLRFQYRVKIDYEQ